MAEKTAQKMMTVCVGRFVIDLPESAQVEFAPARVAGVTIGVTLELETGIGRPGEPVNSSLSDDAALVLWDKIAGSLRLRRLPAQTKVQPSGV